MKLNKIIKAESANRKGIVFHQDNIILHTSMITWQKLVGDESRNDASYTA